MPAENDPVPMPGEPSTWVDVTTDLLRYVRAASPTREALLERTLASTPAERPAAAERTVARLEGLDLVETDEDDCALSPAGREHLECDGEVVLYRRLSATVPGFDAVLAALAVRPLTDVEIRDLLAVERGAEDVSADLARTCRRWLVALGYATCEDGVTDLTPAGRRAATDGADPLRTAPVEGDTAPSNPREVAASDATDGSVTDAGVDAAPTTDRGDSVGAGSAGGSPPTGGSGGIDSLEALGRAYDHTCAVCGDRRRRAPDEGFSAVHHLMPTDAPHGGPAAPENTVVVCPNHRADLENGLLAVDPVTLELRHAYESALTGRTLDTVDGHEPGPQFLAYHNDVVVDSLE